MLAHYTNSVVAVCVLCLFVVVPWIGMHTVVVAFLGHRPAHILKDLFLINYKSLFSDLA